jgi:hypothetical protein
MGLRKRCMGCYRSYLGRKEMIKGASGGVQDLLGWFDTRGKVYDAWADQRNTGLNFPYL